MNIGEKVRLLDSKQVGFVREVMYDLVGVDVGGTFIVVTRDRVEACQVHEVRLGLSVKAAQGQ